jgi:hypothetical protein
MAAAPYRGEPRPPPGAAPWGLRRILASCAEVAEGLAKTLRAAEELAGHVDGAVPSLVDSDAPRGAEEDKRTP